ncbi:MAG: Txe/YoeB family addiction module toxin [Bacteroidetes bacterium]|nr:Txe/YoeB family addiction module toxin [Bacteroidota bacterium]MCW5894685.1 Txe/YoeB family addiction module toxin [Bacteroidota bacterium]
MKTVAFQSGAFEQYSNWAKENPKIFERLTMVIRSAAQSPFEGIGKPEPLKHELQGYWSRRITDEHRLVYKVTQDSIIIVSCKYHYKR